MAEKIHVTRPSRGKQSNGAAAKLERLLKRGGKGRYVLRLYVAGTTPRSARSVANIHSLCEERLAGRYDLEVIDIYQQPRAAVDEQIIAVPMLVKKLPEPVRRMVGDLSKRDRVLVALDLHEKAGEVKTDWAEV